MRSALAREMFAYSGMRVLSFATKACWPPNTGAKLRNFYLARELAQSARVTCLGFSDDCGPGKTDGKVEGNGNHRLVGASHLPDPLEQACEQVITVARDRGYTLSKIVRGAISKTPLPVLNYTTRAMAGELARLLDQYRFDVVQVESIHLMAYLPIIRAARNRPLVVCDWHNVESELMWRYSQRAPTLAHRFYARATARRLEELERRAMREFDAHITVSHRDRERLREYAPDARIFIIENGVDVDYYSGEKLEQAYQAWLAHSNAPPFDAPPQQQLASHYDVSQSGPRDRIVFVGSMDYHANVDAVMQFAREVWPRLREQKPELVFTIVGREPSPEVRALAAMPGVEVTGTVDDVRPYYRRAVAAVVPLRVGGGSRLKILEAMAAGVPVVSTTLGAEGLDVRDGENIRLADTCDELCRAIIALFEDEQQRRSLTAAALALVSAHYDWSALGAALLDTQMRLVNNRSVAVV